MSLKLFKISNGALKSDKLPTRLKLLNWGENDSTIGKFSVGQKTMEGISAQAKMGFERVAIDFDHGSVTDTETNKALLKAGQPPLIFGYGRPSVVKDDGLFLEDIIWTPLGAQHARNFEDLSPALNDDAGEVTLLHSVALTPNGKVTGLQFFKAELSTADAGADADEKSDAADMASKAATESSANALESGKDSDHEKAAKLHAKASKAHGEAMVANAKAGNDDDAAGNAKAMKYHDACAGAHGSETKTLSENMSKTISLTILSAALGVAEDENAVATKLKELSALSGKVTSLETTLNESAKADEETERSRILTLLSTEGKAPKKADGTAYSREELLKEGVPVLKLLHANTPVTVPLSARSATGMTDGKKSFVQRDEKGRVVGVDMAGILNAENAASGN